MNVSEGIGQAEETFQICSTEQKYSNMPPQRSAGTGEDKPSFTSQCYGNPNVILIQQSHLIAEVLGGGGMSDSHKSTKLSERVFNRCINSTVGSPLC